MLNDVDLLYENYQKGEIDYKRLKESIALFVYAALKRNHRLSEDAIHDLFISFFLQIDRLMVRYNPSIRSFHGYLMMLLQYMALSKSRNEKSRRNREAALYSYQMQCYDEEQPFVCDSSSAQVYTANCEDSVSKAFLKNETIEAVKQKMKALKGKPNQLARVQREVGLILLKESPCLSAPEIDSLIEAYQLDGEVINHFLLLISMMNTQKRDQLQRLNRIQNRYFTQLQSLHRDYSMCRETEKRAALSAQIQQTKIRREKVMQKIAHFKLKPSNRQLSELTHIPKGTIDSIFYKMNGSLDL